MEIIADFIFSGSKITADGDYSHETERQLLLGSKVMTNLDSILKSRDITLPTKVHIVNAMVFPVVMYGCELDHKEVCSKGTKWSRSVVSNSLRSHGLQLTRLLRPWNFPGKSPGVGCHFLLQGIFPTQGMNLGSPTLQADAFTTWEGWALKNWC